ncbi:unnamed protein product, partial [marine sediment metagenome]
PIPLAVLPIIFAVAGPITSISAHWDRVRCLILLVKMN